MNIRSIVIVSFLIGTTSQAQFAYPSEDFLGGGIGISPMFIMVDSLPGEENLEKLGLNKKGFDNLQPLTIMGGEGFAHITGRWRIGGYAGFGVARNSTIPEIVLWQDLDDDGEIGDGDTTSNYTNIYNPTFYSSFSYALGAASVEYVIPIFQDLELSGGALLGLGRITLSVEQTIGNPKWDDSFSNVYGSVVVGGKKDTLYYEVDSLELGADILPSIQLPGLLRNLSGMNFNFQPYIAIKWQFLERLGIRASTGFNQLTIGNGSWRLNGRNQIGDSKSFALQGLAFRAMLYVGL